jgi:hypothetical protein
MPTKPLDAVVDGRQPTLKRAVRGSRGVATPFPRANTARPESRNGRVGGGRGEEEVDGGVQDEDARLSTVKKSAGEWASSCCPAAIMIAAWSVGARDKIRTESGAVGGVEEEPAKARGQRTGGS